ncbi:MAG: type I restriction-modification enzyme R subunit C-terminal domain-containing protein, partial [Phascolarctobacterium sp.]
PDWDGPVQIDPGFDPERPITPPPTPPTPPITPPQNDKPIVDKNGCKVEIWGKRVSVYDSNGKLLKQESIVDYTKENIRGEYASLDKFIQEWRKDTKKDRIKNMLLERGIALEPIKAEQNMQDVDDFDFICHVAYDQKPMTRKERATKVKQSDFFSKYSGVARKVLEALLDKYMNVGIYEITKTEVLKLDPFMRIGSPSKIAKIFGGNKEYKKAVEELENAIYEEVV